MATLQDYGGLLLGSRLKRLSEALYTGVDEVYRAQGVDLPSRCFPVLLLLRDNGPLGITQLATLLGQSHAAVSQLSRLLLEQRVVVEKADPADERRRLLALTSRGTRLLGRMGEVWQAITAAVGDLSAAAGVDLVATVGALDGALDQRGFAERVHARLRLRQGDEVEIIAYEPRYREDFERLNVEWLETYFYVEEIDVQVLRHPEEVILRPGGFIFLARHGEEQREEIVGTCALIKAGAHRFELSKMAVTPRYQGLRIGQRLLEAAIKQFRALRGDNQLFLESNSKLAPALRLYEASGFRHAQRPGGRSHYQRSDVYMVYDPVLRGKTRRGGGGP
jgi:GNAT superfamily N-acetyltransferase/DNA-binding MarR family transcriptional regulator